MKSLSKKLIATILIGSCFFVCSGQKVNYQWNKQKTIAVSTLVFTSAIDGILEGYLFDGRRSFERKFGVDNTGFWGAKSYLRAYKNFDEKQGYSNYYSEKMGAFDFYHIADDTRKFGYISAGIFIGIGGKKQNWKACIIDGIIYSVASSLSKKYAMEWVRD